jgi:hypothetical protein
MWRMQKSADTGGICGARQGRQIRRQHAGVTIAARAFRPRRSNSIVPE